MIVAKTALIAAAAMLLAIESSHARKARPIALPKPTSACHASDVCTGRLVVGRDPGPFISGRDSGVIGPWAGPTDDGEVLPELPLPEFFCVHKGKPRVDYATLGRSTKCEQ